MFLWCRKMEAMTRILMKMMGIMLWLTVLIAMAVGEDVKYKDPKQPVAVRIKDLMSRMTLEEKIGQMVQIDRLTASPDIMQTYCIGSVLSGGGSAPLPEASAEDWVNMINGFQNGSLSGRLGIPMIYGIDAVHGHNNVFNATIFPHNIGLGATRQVDISFPFLQKSEVIYSKTCWWDPDLVKRIGSATALEVRATGIPYVFAPCIAVCKDPRWGRCYESYSEDHKVVEAMTEIIPGLQGDIPVNSRKGVPYVGGKKKVAACAKHFVGDGGTTKGINENNTVIDKHGLLSIHMPAYSDSIIKGVSTIMVSYSSWNGVKMHANRELITGFLKNTLKFKIMKVTFGILLAISLTSLVFPWFAVAVDLMLHVDLGFVISDWQGIDRITSPPHANYSYSVQAAIQAGIDMVMLPFKHTEFIDDLTYLVKSNVIPMDRINDAVGRILLVKFTLGLFENPLADLSLVNELGSQAHRDLAREAVRKSLVLLKNGKNETDPLLPLPGKVSKILVAGTHADNLGYQCGGWSIQWQGFSGNRDTRGTTILGAIKSTVDPSTEVVFQENPDSKFIKDNNFAYAIIVVGEPPYAETAGDSMDLTMIDPGPSVISNVCETVKCVVVVISGRPIVIEPYLSSIDALVAAWLPGTEGQGVADALFGDYGFTGKLPRTWFKNVDQLPMNVGDPHYDPLFPFDFGLKTKSAPDILRRQV
ncbi:beta-glucosidase BoGH3B-like [Populus alba x Populus x berolinensis]|nr:beta-glucosidase BoGH3B-like [Populus alba x Populus x berolinensis]